MDKFLNHPLVQYYQFGSGAVSNITPNSGSWSLSNTISSVWYLTNISYFTNTFYQWLTYTIQYIEWNYIQAYGALQFCDYELNKNGVSNCFQWAWVFRPLYVITMFSLIFGTVFTVVVTYVATKYFLEISGGYVQFM